MKVLQGAVKNLAWLATAVDWEDGHRSPIRFGSRPEIAVFELTREG